MLGLGVAKKKFSASNVAPCASASPAPSRAELRNATFAYAQRGCEAGCDVVEFHQVGEDRLVFMLLDVAGDRAAGSPLAAGVAAAFQQHAAVLFAAADLNQAEALTNLAMLLNRAVMSEGRVRCAAAFLGCFDAQTGALWYVNAGHTPALVHDGTNTELRATGVPFGLFSHAIHEAQVTVLDVPSAFLLISKGLTEMGGRRREFGLAGAKNVITERAANAQQLCAAVLDAADTFAGSRNLRQQDRTAVALVRQ